MNNIVMNDEFARGQKDCLDGKPQQSKDPDYTLGYGEQYALEQAATHQTEKMMRETML